MILFTLLKFRISVINDLTKKLEKFKATVNHEFSKKVD